MAAQKISTSERLPLVEADIHRCFAVGRKVASGDPCPKAGSFPVAYDSRQGVFLLIPDESRDRSVTLVYSPGDNRYIRVNGAEMPANGMNYMMEYDPYHHVFLLVTGDWKTPVAVWAFRLDMSELARH